LSEPNFFISGSSRKKKTNSTFVVEKDFVLIYFGKGGETEKCGIVTTLKKKRTKTLKNF